jgi:ribulose-phosphate 3-epimerase
MGTSIINCFREIFHGPFDYHLMVQEPSRLFESFDIREGDSFAIHQECCRNLHKDLIELRKLGAKVGVALSPSTEISTLDYIIEDLDYVLLMTVNPGFKGQNILPNSLNKIKDLKDYISLRNLDVKIHVDGNVSIKNIPTMVQNGGNTLISGSSGMFFKDLNLAESIKRFKEAINRGLHESA